VQHPKEEKADIASNFIFKNQNKETTLKMQAWVIIIINIRHEKGRLD
jgi:hypothetical protein